MSHQMRHAGARFIPFSEPTQFHNVSLSKRQSCVGNGYLPCIDNLNNCCPYDQSCCGSGCCNTGYYCVNASGGPTCCPLTADPSECGDQSTTNVCPMGYSQCTTMSGCCPTGEECYYDSIYGGYCAVSGGDSISSPIIIPTATTSYDPLYTPYETTSTSDWVFDTTTSFSSYTSTTDSILPIVSPTSPPLSTHRAPRFPKAAIGGIVGGVAFLIVLIVIIVKIIKKWKKQVPPPPPPQPVEFYHRWHSPIHDYGYTRVLHLYGIPQGGNSSAPLHGWVEVIRIGDPMATKYTALSYSWTRDSKAPISMKDRELYCDIGKEGGGIAIFMLEEASAELLRGLRSSTEIVLWLDQVCIDQRKGNEFREEPFENLDQKKQLSRMGDIYKNATSTIIWLGVEDPPAYPQVSPLKTAMDLVPILAADYEQGRQPQVLMNNSYLYLLQLFSRRWIKRVWTFQEIIKSKQVSVVIKTALSTDLTWGTWHEFGAAVMCYQRWSIQKPIKYSNDLEAIVMKYLCWRSGRDTWPLLTILDLFRAFDVTYACDKLYGIQSLVEEAKGPDTNDEFALAKEEPYRKQRLSVFDLPVPQREHGWHIYQELAISLIERTNSLNILSAVQHIDETTIQKASGEALDLCKSKPTPPLPSWVPNWYEKSPCSPISHIGPSNTSPSTPDHEFHACSLPHLGSSVLGVTRKHLLRVKGMVLSKIIDSTDVSYGRTFDAAITGEFKDLSPNLWAAIPMFLGIAEEDLNMNIAITEENERYHDQRKLNAVRQVAVFFTGARTEDRSHLTLNPSQIDGTPVHPEHSKLYGSSHHQSPYQRLHEHFLDFMAFRSLWDPTRKPIPGQPHPDQVRITRYAKAAAAAHMCRKTFQMENMKIGHGPGVLDFTRQDVVCILQGADVPFVLRPQGKSEDGFDSYEVIGECYVHSVMEGEAVVGIDQWDHRWKTFDLV